MKIKVVTLFLALLLSFVTVGFAQVQADETVKAKVPFNFYAGNHLMPAGTYSVGVDYANRLVIIRDQANGHEMFLPGDMSDNATGKLEMVFDHLGDTYFLRDVKTSDTDLKFAVRKLETRVAQNVSPVEAVIAVN